jgi:hypothetical protein
MRNPPSESRPEPGAAWVAMLRSQPRAGSSYRYTHTFGLRERASAGSTCSASRGSSTWRTTCGAIVS